MINHHECKKITQRLFDNLMTVDIRTRPCDHCGAEVVTSLRNYLETIPLLCEDCKGKKK